MPKMSGKSVNKSNTKMVGKRSNTTKKSGSKKSEPVLGIDWDRFEQRYNKNAGKRSESGRGSEYGKRNDTSRGFETGKRGDSGRGSEYGKKSDSRRNSEYGKRSESGRDSEYGKRNEFRRDSESYSKNDKKRESNSRFDSPRKGEAAGRGKENKASTSGKQGRGRTKGPKTTVSGERICPLHEKCGGCNLQGTDYVKQLIIKHRTVSELVGKSCKVEKIVGMQDPYHYRNKVHAVFDRDHRGNYISGIYQEGSHDVVHVEECFIENQKADEIIGSIRSLLRSFKIKTYDEDTGFGLLRHVLVRTGYHSGEIMVVLVVSSPVFPSKNNFVKALLKLHPEITTIVLNFNNRQTSMVLGDKETVLYGKGYIEDTLCDCKFRISPKSFYQVNPLQTEHLYNKAIEYAGLTGKQKVIDAYCGIGTIGLIASKHAKEVIGIELNKDAVKDAIENAKLNQIRNVTFYNNDAGVFMEEMASQDAFADVVFMDPPRSGSTEVFMDSVVKLHPAKVVYVSCNPETLARDLEYITKKGYKVSRVTPFDMFPFTDHVETVVLLERKDR